jgi:hypothetical protein
LKEYDEEMAAVDQPTAAQQVFANMTELAGEGTTNLPANPEGDHSVRQEDEVLDDSGQNNLPHHRTNFRCRTTSSHPEPHEPLHHSAVILADTKNSWSRPSCLIM